MTNGVKDFGVLYYFFKKVIRDPNKVKNFALACYLRLSKLRSINPHHLTKTYVHLASVCLLPRNDVSLNSLARPRTAKNRILYTTSAFVL